MKKTAPLLLLIVLSFWYFVFGLKQIEAKTEVITPTAEIAPTISETTTPELILINNNITESEGKEIKVEKIKWRGINTFKVAINWAARRGLSNNTLVLLLLLPLVATLVSFLHYVVGLSGYGIFMPTMIAIVFLATGIFGGLILFAWILLISLFSNTLLNKFKLHFWPARSISLLFISIGTFGLMVVSSFIKLIDISKISIFPILFMILLTEEFTRTQLVKSKKEAKKLTVGTIILAITGAGVMNFSLIQEFVLKYPDTMIVIVLVVNLLVGNYTGIRWSEIGRFKKAIREKK
jgi:hypothetical protein